MKDIDTPGAKRLVGVVSGEFPDQRVNPLEDRGEIDAWSFDPDSEPAGRPEIVCTRVAAWIRALLMTLGECPWPMSFPFSISATRAPTLAAAVATLRPPEPPPRTTRSYIVRFSQRSRERSIVSRR